MNIASRLESLTRPFGCDALVTGDCVLQCPTALRECLRFVGGIFLKGKNTVTRVGVAIIIFTYGITGARTRVNS